jgi:cell division protein ZapE
MDSADFNGVRKRYEALVRDGKVSADPAQQRIANKLDRVIDEIRSKRLSSKSSALGWLFAKRRSDAKAAIKGLYIHGSVGRGKTMLMDLFFEAVPAKRKRRVHFHDFMSDVHGRIHAHRQALKAGETKQDDPIPPVAEALHQDAWVLCFDEFSVTDITDAMILSRLFTRLFEKGCVLIATSNVEPHDLYRDGLNRALFLPFIDLLKAHVEIVSLDARTDYRLEKSGRVPTYLSPISEQNAAAFEGAWRSAVGGGQAKASSIPHRGRSISIPSAAANAARFHFRDLCEAPLGASDFRAIADRFDTIFIEGVPVLRASQRNEAKRFIILIDTLYDAKTRLHVLADAEPDELYPTKRKTEGFEFDRTVSRLIEMRSEDYARERESSQPQPVRNTA